MSAWECLTIPQVKMLVECEAGMDNGTIPYVVVDGARWAFPGELLQAVGLTSGATVSQALCYQLQLLTLQYLREKIQEQEQEQSTNEKNK